LDPGVILNTWIFFRICEQSTSLGSGKKPLKGSSEKVKHKNLEENIERKTTLPTF